MVASTALLAAAAGACSWSLNYLDSGPADTDPHPDVVVPSTDAASISDAASGGPNTDTAQGAAEAADNEASAALGDGGNLIQNPSCEDGTTDWSTLGQTPLESSTTFVHTGDTASCHAYDRVHEETSGTLPSYDGPMQDITAVVVPGHQYGVSAWALWAPPTAPDSGSDEAEGGPSQGSDGSSDGAGGATDSGTDGGGGYEQQNAYITVKETCGSSTSYVRLASATNLPEETWTEVDQATSLLTVPVGCTPLDLQLYIEGPDVGLDLYVDEVTLQLVN